MESAKEKLEQISDRQRVYSCAHSFIYFSTFHFNSVFNVFFFYFFFLFHWKYSFCLLLLLLRHFPLLFCFFFFYMIAHILNFFCVFQAILILFFFFFIISIFLLFRLLLCSAVPIIMYQCADANRGRCETLTLPFWTLSDAQLCSCTREIVSAWTRWKCFKNGRRHLKSKDFWLN